MLVDSHIHLDASTYADDRTAVIRRAHESGVAQMVLPSTDTLSWPRIRQLCRTHAEAFPAYGWHPLFLPDNEPFDVHALSSCLTDGGAVAVGEIGLDFHHAQSDRAQQRAWFEAQLQLAHDRNLPVIVHARQALEEVILTLRRFTGLRGVVHSFSGSQQQAERLWALGFHVGIGGPVTYPRAQRLRRLVAHMPVRFLLLETDAPDQPDVDHRGQRNEPAHLAGIAQCIAELRGEPLPQLAASTSTNARRLFGLPETLD